jgi:hypothetical protein
MRRREFIVGLGALAAPTAGHAVCWVADHAALPDLRDKITKRESINLGGVNY